MFTEDSIKASLMKVAKRADKVGITPRAVYQTQVDQFPQGFPYIPAHEFNLVECLTDACRLFETRHGRKPKSFIDLGCGFGRVPMMAHHLGMKAYGIEYSQSQIDHFLRLKMKYKEYEKVQISQGDILKWKPNQEFDIVYFFQPISKDRLWKKFLKRVQKVCPDLQVIASFFGMGLITFHPEDWPGWEPDKKGSGYNNAFILNKDYQP